MSVFFLFSSFRILWLLLHTHRRSEAIAARSRSTHGRPQFTSQSAFTRRARPWPAGLSRLVFISCRCFFFFFVGQLRNKTEKEVEWEKLQYYLLLHPPPLQYYLSFLFSRFLLIIIQQTLFFIFKIIEFKKWQISCLCMSCNLLIDWSKFHFSFGLNFFFSRVIRCTCVLCVLEQMVGGRELLPATLWGSSWIIFSLTRHPPPTLCWFIIFPPFRKNKKFFKSDKSLMVTDTIYWRGGPPNHSQII